MIAIKQRQLHVFPCRCARQQIEVLKNKTDLAIANIRELVPLQSGHIRAVEQVSACAWPIETAENIHQSRFAGAARAHQGNKFTALDLERNAAHRAHFHLAGAIRFLHVDQSDNFTVVHVDAFSVLFMLLPLLVRGRNQNRKRFDSFVSRLSRRYPCGVTVHVARPTRSILDFARNDKAHGKRRGPPPNGLAGGEAAAVVAVSSAVTTPSPSFKPSTTSVMTPSLIPVLICTACGRLPDKT